MLGYSVFNKSINGIRTISDGIAVLQNGTLDATNVNATNISGQLIAKQNGLEIYNNLTIDHDLYVSGTSHLANIAFSGNLTVNNLNVAGAILQNVKTSTPNLLSNDTTITGSLTCGTTTSSNLTTTQLDVTNDATIEHDLYCRHYAYLDGIWQTTSTANKLTNLTVDNNIALGGAILQSVKTATPNVLSNNTTISGDTTITGSMVFSGPSCGFYNSSLFLYNGLLKQMYDTTTTLTNDLFAKTIFSNGIKLLNTSSIELDDGTSITQSGLKSIATNTADITTINSTLAPVSYVANSFKIDTDKITFSCIPNSLELSFDNGLKYNGSSVSLLDIATNTANIATNTATHCNQ
jgi:hypothetical protein